MIIRISDIPVEGRDLAFDLNESALNERAQAAQHHGTKDKPAVDEPAYYFQPKPRAALHLDLEGSQVFLSGQIEASYRTSCSRCAEETTKSLSLPISMVLKPHAPGRRALDEDEDVSLSYYEGDEIDCGVIVEEHIILALPYTVLCSEECKGLCPQCGVNLNTATCSCKQPEFRDERFKVLERLKIQ